MYRLASSFVSSLSKVEHCVFDCTGYFGTCTLSFLSSVALKACLYDGVNRRKAERKKEGRRTLVEVLELGDPRKLINTLYAHIRTGC